MRPVNLMPMEARGRGSSGGPGARTGPAAFVLLGALALALGALTYSSLLSNSVSEKQKEVADLTAQENAMRAQAQSLQAFSDFKAREARRTASVASLAQSRFDWDRVMRELAGVLPANIWLVEMAGETVDPGLASSDPSAAGAPPSVSIVGCGPGHEAVAAYAAALEDIDGVSDVGVTSSELPTPIDKSSDSGGGFDSEGSECRTKEFISKFEIKVLFRTPAVPVGAIDVPGIPEGAAPPAAGSTQAAEGAVGTSETADADGGSAIPAGAVR